MAIHDGSLFNYADDNSALVTGNNTDEVISKMSTTGADLLEWCESNQMEANPSKFQALISKSTKAHNIPIKNDMIQSEPHVKLLGVNLDDRLSFNQHIDYLIKRASRQLNCLIRFSRTLCVDVKLLLYKSFILSNFNFCPVVWHHCGKVNTKRLEKLQHRALKYVFRDFHSSYCSLLSRAKLPTLELSRLRAIALEAFKGYNNMSPQFIQDMLTKPTHTYDLRAKNKLHKPCFHSATGAHSFSFTAAQVWNSLPNELRTTSDIKVFKTLLNSWQGPDCKCTYCRMC